MIYYQLYGKVSPLMRFNHIILESNPFTIINKLKIKEAGRYEFDYLLVSFFKLLGIYFLSFLHVVDKEINLPIFQ